MKMPDRILDIPQGVGCLACLAVGVPWVVGFVKLADWAITWAMK